MVIAAGTLVLSGFSAAALGGFSAGITGPADNLGSGDMVAQVTANGQACTSSTGQIVSNSAGCQGSVLPTGTIPASTSTPLAGTATVSDLGTLGGTASLSGGSCGAWGAQDATGNGNAGLVRAGVAATTGPLSGSGALQFDGSTGWIETASSYADPAPLTEAVWFRTTSQGTIMGATNAQSNSGQSNWDRQLWIDAAGNLVFGVYNGATTEAVSPGRYNNGGWHLAVASIGPSHEQLYVDGALVTTNTNATSPQSYTAWWHIGWDSESGWANAPTSAYFNGSVAFAAVFPTQLSAARVSSLYAAGTSVSAYESAVAGDSPTVFWPLQDTGYIYPGAIPGAPASTLSFPDLSGNGNAGTGQGGITPGLSGPPTLSGSGSAGFDGSTGYVETTTASNPQTLTEAIWFSTTASGVLLGLTNQQTNATPGDYDRAIWLDSAGQVVYGDWPQAVQEVVSPGSYDNGKWHLAVAEVGLAGQKLYVDGTLVASNAAYTTPQSYSGWWHIGYGNESAGWTNPPAGNYFAGDLADAAVFPTQLSAAQVSGLWSSTSQAAYESAVLALTPTSFWTLSEGPPSICSYIGFTLQSSSPSTCLSPAGSGACPTLTGSGDPLLAWLANTEISLGSLSAGASLTLSVSALEEGSLPSAYSGLHPTLALGFEISDQTWSATVTCSGGEAWVAA